MQSLSVKYRPKTFEEVCSQTSIIKILTRQIQLQEIKNVYLFCGASGCGKTSLARLFANEINNHVGTPIEIDGASNNGVDNVKQIIRSANERSIDSKYKVYIIDECQSLSNAAWQAFLKCIEEPPTFTVFIFCTTDPQKIPATILNRVMRFNFNRISSSVINERLQYICREEGFTNYAEGCDYISRICNGGMRDGIALLEKCASYDTDITISNVLSALGNYSYDVQFELVNKIIDGDVMSVLQIINKLYEEGNDLKLFIDQFLAFNLDICKYILMGSYEVTKLPSSMADKLNYAINFGGAANYYYYVVDKLLVLKNMLKNDVDYKSTIEVMLTQISRCQ